MFAQKLHKGLSRLRLPLEYMAICALCAKDPVKERRAHARQCLVKNITVRREYLKQHAAVSGECTVGEEASQLLSVVVLGSKPHSCHLFLCILLSSNSHFSLLVLKNLCKCVSVQVSLSFVNG